MGFRFEKAKGPWRLSYESGKYQLSAKTANCGVMVTPNAAVEGCAVEVKGHRLSGTDADYGILFGIGADWASFYEAAISGSAWGMEVAFMSSRSPWISAWITTQG